MAEAQTEAIQNRNELIAGTIAGFVCKLVEYPLDTVKVQAQTQVALPSSQWPVEKANRKTVHTWKAASSTLCTLGKQQAARNIASGFHLRHGSVPRTSAPYLVDSPSTIDTRSLASLNTPPLPFQSATGPRVSPLTLLMKTLRNDGFFAL